MRPTLLVMLASLFVSACAFEAVEDQGRWTVDHIEESGAVLSVWGTGPDDVWAAGGRVGHGLLLHNDGSGWTRHDVPEATELLSWVYGFRADDVYAVGEGGLILHYDGSGWSQVESGTDAPLYGVWGAPGGDVWIAGGDPSGEAGSAVLLRGHDRRFERVELPAELAPGALFKVYGFHDEILAVGGGGAVLRFDGEAWRRDEVPTSEPLFSMWGRGENDVYAVGGYAQGELLHFDGQAWRRDPGTGLVPALGGVFTAPGHPVIAVGEQAYVVEIDADGAVTEPLLPEVVPRPTLHGVWGDGSGTVYAVGGDLNRYPELESGVIFRRR